MKTRVDQCSIWTYDEMKKSGELGENQRKFLHAFVTSDVPLTARQAVDKVEKTYNRPFITNNGRITELTLLGFLSKVDQVKDDLTNEKVNRWEWTGRKKGLVETEEWRTCTCCGGIGKAKVKVYSEPITKIQPDLL